MKYILFFFISSFLFTGCLFMKGEKGMNHEMILEDFILSNPEFFPINNIHFLENIYREKLKNDCTLNMDSIKAKWTIPNSYGGTDIANEKIKSIYRNAISYCTDGYEKEIIYSYQDISDWATSIFRNYYGEEVCINSSENFKGNFIKGLPYRFKRQVKIPTNHLLENNDKYIKLSPIHVCGKYRLIELTYGGKNRGEQRNLYVLIKYYDKWIIENVFYTNYKF